MLLSQSSSTPLQISAEPRPCVHTMTPFWHCVTPPQPPHGADWKSSSTVPSQSLSMPSQTSVVGPTSPVHAPNLLLPVPGSACSGQVSEPG